MYNDPQFKTNDGAALRMWREPVTNKFLSDKFGRTVADEVIFVEVITPGSSGSSPVFELKRTFSDDSGLGERFKQYVEIFENTDKSTGELAGTQLSEWPPMSQRQAYELKSQGIFTVEGLSSLPDGQLHKVGPDGRTWREKAKAWLESVGNSAYAIETAAKFEQQNQEIDELKRQIAELAAANQALQDAKEVSPPPPPTAKTSKTSASII
jgi:hypothetical protein